MSIFTELIITKHLDKIHFKTDFLKISSRRNRSNRNKKPKTKQKNDESRQRRTSHDTTARREHKDNVTPPDVISWGVITVERLAKLQ